MLYYSVCNVAFIICLRRCEQMKVQRGGDQLILFFINLLCACLIIMSSIKSGLVQMARSCHFCHVCQSSASVPALVWGRQAYGTAWHCLSTLLHRYPLRQAVPAAFPSEGIHGFIFILIELLISDLPLPSGLVSRASP